MSVPRLVWEPIAEDRAMARLPPEHRTYRARIPGGWLVTAYCVHSAPGTSHCGGVAFVSDPQHAWRVAEPASFD